MIPFTKVCKETAWCPVEEPLAFPSSSQAILEDSRNLEITIENQVQFPEF